MKGGVGMGHSKAQVRTTVSASQSTLVSRALLWFVREYLCEGGGGGYVCVDGDEVCLCAWVRDSDPAHSVV